MSGTTKAGIQTSVDGQAYIPSSRRADGSTRKEIKIRPGYRPPEDVEAYKSRNAEDFRSGRVKVPGIEEADSEVVADPKSKNAKRREAARRKKALEEETGVDDVTEHVGTLDVNGEQSARRADVDKSLQIDDADAETQKKVRNQLKKLRAVHVLKEKRLAGEKLTADQLVKVSKEHEIIRDLLKLNYDGPELHGEFTSSTKDSVE